MQVVVKIETQSWNSFSMVGAYIKIQNHIAKAIEKWNTHSSLQNQKNQNKRTTLQLSR